MQIDPHTLLAIMVMRTGETHIEIPFADIGEWKAKADGLVLVVGTGPDRLYLDMMPHTEARALMQPAANEVPL